MCVFIFELCINVNLTDINKHQSRTAAGKCQNVNVKTSKQTNSWEELVWKVNMGGSYWTKTTVFS